MTANNGRMTANDGLVTGRAARVALVSLGCAKNLVNSEQMMFLLREAGFEVTGETQGADVVVVNTCAFIESAKQEAIETIIEFGIAKEEGRLGSLVVAGCLAQRYKDEILTEMPEVDAVVGTGSFDDVVKAVSEAIGGRSGYALFGDIDAPVSETGRIITTSKAWAYLKIAEGCDNRCAYCAIPDIRGRYRSRTMERIVQEARELAGRGLKELIVVAQDVTNYGLDLYGKRRLADLLKYLCEIEELKWIRLHYLYPGDIDEELIDVIAGNGKILKYLDIPIQHINDDILRKMNRRGSGIDIRGMFRRLRESIPGVVIRTSVITGLPGEGESEFEELYEFLRSERIERAGVFRYSPEEGTPAALMDVPDADTAARRAEILTDLQSHIMDDYSESRIGSLTEVIIEGSDDGRSFGRSFAESPDVDGYVYVYGSGIAVNDFVTVRITGVENGEPTGECVFEYS